MRKYEIMFIVRPDVEEANIKTIFENMKNVVTEKGANILDAKEMGQRELAYEISKYRTGYYFLITVESENDAAINEFDRLALISEDIIRHLIVRVDK